MILGVIVNVSVAWASTQLPSINGKNRIKSAWASFFGLMILSPLLVAPAMWIIIMDLPIGMLVYFLAIGLSIAPDLAIALVGFLAGKSLIPLQQPAEQPHSETKKPQSEKSGRTATPKKSQSEIPCRYAGAGCELSGSQNAMNAHARHCKFKPATVDDLIDVSAKK